MIYKDRRDYVELIRLPSKCNTAGVNITEVIEVFDSIESVSIESEKRNPFMQLELSRQIQKHQQTSLSNMVTGFQALGKIIEPDLTQDERNVISMIHYLIVAESLYEFVINQLCCILVKVGVAHPFDPNNAGSCEGISEESLGTKRSFLRTAGLTQLADSFDNHIRNAAGHQMFEIRANGIYIPKRDRVIQPDTEYAKLRNAAMVGYHAILHYYDLHHGPLAHFSDSTFTTEAGIETIEKTMPKMQNADPTRWSAIAQAAEADVSVPQN